MSAAGSLEPTSTRAEGRFGQPATATQVGGLLVGLSLLALAAFAVLAAYVDFPGVPAGRAPPSAGGLGCVLGPTADASAPTACTEQGWAPLTRSWR